MIEKYNARPRKKVKEMPKQTGELISMKKRINVTISEFNPATVELVPPGTTDDGIFNLTPGDFNDD